MSAITYQCHECLRFVPRAELVLATVDGRDVYRCRLYCESTRPAGPDGVEVGR